MSEACSEYFDMQKFIRVIIFITVRIEKNIYIRIYYTRNIKPVVDTYLLMSKLYVVCIFILNTFIALSWFGTA